MLPQTDMPISRFTVEKQSDNRILFITYNNFNNPLFKMLLSKDDVLTIMAYFSSVLREDKFN